MIKTSHRTLFFLGFIATVILLGIAFYLQKFDGFIPCPLCILQRISLVLLGIIFFLGAAFKLKKIGNLFFSVLASLMALLGVLLSGRQVWLQHLPPDKNADCGVSLKYLINALPFDEVVSKVLHGSAECSQKGWEFFHLSMAEWSLVCFIGFLLFCLMQIRRALKS